MPTTLNGSGPGGGLSRPITWRRTSRLNGPGLACARPGRSAWSLCALRPRRMAESFNRKARMSVAETNRFVSSQLLRSCGGSVGWPRAGRTAGRSL